MTAYVGGIGQGTHRSSWMRTSETGHEAEARHGPDHLLHHPPPPLPRHRRGGDHAQARLGQRDHQRGPRPHGLALPRRRLAADGGRGLPAPPHQRGGGLQGGDPPLRGRHRRGRRVPHQLPLHRGAAHLRHLPGGADPPRGPAGGVERLLRPRLRHRRHGARRLQPGFARHLHRGLLVPRHQAGRGRDHAPRHHGHAAQHGARAGDGGARPLVDDRRQQRRARAHGGADREVRRRPRGPRLRRAGGPVGDPLPQAPARAARRPLGIAPVLRHRGRDLQGAARHDQGGRRRSPSISPAPARSRTTASTAPTGPRGAASSPPSSRCSATTSPGTTACSGRSA